MKNAVRNLAYSLWEQAGRPGGRDQEFWLEAERLLVKPDRASRGMLAPREAKAEAAEKDAKGSAAPKAPKAAAGHKPEATPPKPAAAATAADEAPAAAKVEPAAVTSPAARKRKKP